MSSPAPPAPVFTDADKRVDLERLAAHVDDGHVLAIGGGLSSREPMAALRAILRRGVTDLTVVGSAHGIDIDLLCAGGAVGATGQSYVGFEQDFGMAPHYRRACQSGAVRVEDGCCYTLVQQLRAAIAGLPFMPIRSVRGTDFERLHPDWQAMTCPYTGQELLLAPALAPDVAVLHAQYADSHGNLLIQGPPVADVLFAQASRKVIATVEEIVSNEVLRELGSPNVPFFYVAAIAEVPLGAHPTACYPFYAYDRPHTGAYLRAAQAGDEVLRAEYLDPFVYDCPSHAAYLERIGGEATRRRLASWREGDAAWQALYREGAP